MDLIRILCEPLDIPVEMGKQNGEKQQKNINKS